MLSSLLPSAKVMLFSAEQPWNAPCAIVETLLGIVIDVIDEFANAA